MTFTVCGESPVWQIKYIPGYENEIYENLTLAKNELNTFTMYQKSEIPESWHIKRCRRQADLLLVANTSYAFSDANNLKGDHGYDLTELKMRPFFIVNGPLFKLNYTVQSLNSIDIYPLIMKILHLKLTPNYVQLKWNTNEYPTYFTLGMFSILGT